MGEREQAKRAVANARREAVASGLAGGKTKAQLSRELGISKPRVGQIVKENEARRGVTPSS